MHQHSEHVTVVRVHLGAPEVPAPNRIFPLLRRQEPPRNAHLEDAVFAALEAREQGREDALPTLEDWYLCPLCLDGLTIEELGLGD